MQIGIHIQTDDASIKYIHYIKFESKIYFREELRTSSRKPPMTTKHCAHFNYPSSLCPLHRYYAPYLSDTNNLSQPMSWPSFSAWYLQHFTIHIYNMYIYKISTSYTSATYVEHFPTHAQASSFDFYKTYKSTTYLEPHTFLIQLFSYILISSSLTSWNKKGREPQRFLVEMLYC